MNTVSRKAALRYGVCINYIEHSFNIKSGRDSKADGRITSSKFIKENIS